MMLGVNINKKIRVLSAAVYAILTLFVAFIMAWYVLAQQNFCYGLWHDYGGIGANIEKFGPLNEYKHNFEDTTKDQRVALFAEINHAIHHQGEGLREISYQTEKSGRQLLLREPEVIHLQDVARLISWLKPVAMITIFLWLLQLVYLWRSQQIPSGKSQFTGAVGLLVILSLVIFAIGPEQVFYRFHEWIFPENHQWFFYYQDSLMSTMMKAPVLFAWIALSLVVVAALFFLLLQQVIAKTLKPRRMNSTLT